MGYLTTITFRNDSYSDFKHNPKDLHKLVLDALEGEQLLKGRDTQPIGSSANPVVIQKPRHADDRTIYMHAGNNVYDLSTADHLWVIETAIDELKYRLRQLKERKDLL